MIDLRSDVKTMPSHDMVRAMAAAELGDEQEREDPTVLRLEDELANLLGQQVAVFVPSATMANQIALLCQVQRGQEVIGEETSHIFRYEAGGPAFLSGAVMTGVVGNAGVISGDAIRDIAQVDESEHRPRTRLVVVEDTHNVSGARVWPLTALDEVYDTCASLGLAVHIDGARVFNASCAQGVEAARITSRAQSVAICFSKGLGCPAGAALVGQADALAPARRMRQMLGGSLRQAGVLAAAASFALLHNVERLAEDNANARKLAKLLAEAGLPVDPTTVDTNFVFLDVASLGCATSDAMDRLRVNGVMWSRTHHPGKLRAVTHLDVSDTDVIAAAERTIVALTERGA